ACGRGFVACTRCDAAGRAALPEAPERHREPRVHLGEAVVVKRVVRAVAERQSRPSGEQAARAPRQRVGLAVPRVELDVARIVPHGAIEHRVPVEPRIDVDRHVLRRTVILRSRGLRCARDRSRREQRECEIHGVHADRVLLVRAAPGRRWSALLRPLRTKSTRNTAFAALAARYGTDRESFALAGRAAVLWDTSSPAHWLTGGHQQWA